jgi:hypothetical protein
MPLDKRRKRRAVAPSCRLNQQSILHETGPLVN